MSGKKKDILFPVLGIVVLGILHFLTHRSIPFMMDDEWYSTNLATGQPLQTLGDVLEGQVWHYLNWGGRSITHGILQLTLMSGELCADILNVLMTLLLAYMICVVSGQKKFYYFLLSFSLLVCWNANTKMSMFWQSGLVNYVYSSVWILLFLYPYLKAADNPEKRVFLSKGQGRLLAALMVPLGLITGWSNENMGPACFLISAMVIIYLKGFRKQQVSVWMYLGAVTSLIGSCFVILAPGNFVRSGAILEKTIGQKIWDRLFGMLEAGAEFLFPVVIVLAVLLLVYMVQLGGKLQAGQILLLTGMVLSYGAMILSPHYPDRATFGTMVLGLVLVNSLIGQIIRRQQVFVKYINLLQAAVWIYSVVILLETMAQKGI